jgi:hypothetical protein
MRLHLERRFVIQGLGGRENKQHGIQRCAGQSPIVTASAAALFVYGGVSTTAAVKRRTSGKTASKVGKAINQDKPQEPSHSCSTPGAKPTPRKVLIPEIKQVMMQERKKGKAMAA